LSEKKLKPSCPKCGNEKEFEILQADWAEDEEQNHFLVEKVKCSKCGATIKATYKLETWEEWTDES